VRTKKKKLKKQGTLASVVALTGVIGGAGRLVRSLFVVVHRGADIQQEDQVLALLLPK
jgi:hypothetical protein